jgi:methylthioribulose-1-phosphate dehydratase
MKSDEVRCKPNRTTGAVAKWEGKGLQNPYRRFDSAPRLHSSQSVLRILSTPNDTILGVGSTISPRVSQQVAACFMSAFRKSARKTNKTSPRFAFKPEVQLAKLARSCYERGWLLGTSGNFSSVVSRNPFCLAITSTGLEKGSLTVEQFVRVDASGSVTHGSGKPSAETAFHLVVTRVRQAGAVLHTHSVWSTILSERRARERGLWIEGYEMLKGLQGVTSHQHREWLPILENDQDVPQLAREVEKVLGEHPRAHGFLLRKHGLYTWGENLSEARRHLEILEFLMEVLGRIAFPEPTTLARG